MGWDAEDWATYRAWEAAWIKEHEHELPCRVWTKNDRWVPLGKKHRHKFAKDAWLEMRRQARAKERGV